MHQTGIRHVSTLVTAPFYVLSQGCDIYTDRNLELPAFDGTLDYRGPSSSISQSSSALFYDQHSGGVSMPIVPQITVQFSVGRQFTRVNDTSVFLVSAVGATVELSYQ